LEIGLIEKRRMSKVRINDLAREMEVKSRQVLDVLAELGLGAGKTHSSSLEADEAEKVRARFQRDSRSSAHSGFAIIERIGQPDSAGGSRSCNPCLDRFVW